MNKPKIRSSVSVVKLNDNIVEFFLTNTRRQIRIKLKNMKLLDLILSLDGNLTFEEICQNYKMDEETKKYFYKYEGEGFRYELLEFVKMINRQMKENDIYSKKEILAAVKIIEQFDAQDVQKM